MAKKVLFSLILLWFAGHLLSTTPFVASPVSDISDCDCNLYPPGNLHATQVGTITADIAWNPVPGADGYKVWVYQKVGNSYTLLNETNHFFTSITVTGLIAGSEHRVTVAGMCWCAGAENNWAVSPRGSSVELPKVILDLDIAQLVPKPTNAYVVQGETEMNDCCYYYFNEMNGKRFWIQVKDENTGACSTHPIRITPAGNATLFKNTEQTDECEGALYTDNIGYVGTTIITEPNINLYYAVIRLQDDLEDGHILRIDAFTSNTNTEEVDKIRIQQINKDYSYAIYELSNLGFGQPNGSDRGAKPPSINPHTYPISPFGENLDIISSAPNDLPIKIQLFDLNGRLAVTQHHGTGKSRYSLPSPDLVPGLYILRIESGEELQTFKVVKTQN